MSIDWDKIEADARAQVTAPEFNVTEFWKPVVPRVKDPACKKCNGRAYLLPPDRPEDPHEKMIEYSICRGCGGFLYEILRDRKSHSSRRNEASDGFARLRAMKEPQAPTPPAPSAATRDLWAEAEAHAEQAVENIYHWNGY